MHGSLALKDGVVWVARHGSEWQVAAYNLDGHRLGPGFSLGTFESGAPQVSGLEVDSDRGLWLADSASEGVRAFSVFGVEGDSIEHAYLGNVSSVAVRGEDESKQIFVASSGLVHGNVQLFDGEGKRVGALRSLGDPAMSFRDIAGIAVSEGLAYVCERRGAVVQVFRGLEFYFAFGLGSDFEPTAAAALSENRVLVTSGGERAGLHLFDAAGRHVAQLAQGGSGDGELLEPSDVVVSEGREERLTRIVVIDSDGDRVQVFSLAGECYGAFPDLG